nr:AraC family transcriptional regulator [Romboutsia sp. 1001713B170207_170306_H8]
MPEKDFVVYYYKDTEIPEVPLHYHEFYELLFLIDGNLDYIVEDYIYHLEKGDLLFIPPGVFHNPIIHNFDVPYERYVLWISVFAINKIFELDEDADIFKDESFNKSFLLRSKGYIASTLQGAFKSLFDSYEEKKYCYKSEGYSIIIQILTMYNRELYNRTKNIMSGSKDTLISSILHYINAHITEDLSLDNIASIFFINKYTISHKFKDVMNISYYQYVIQKRLSIGKQHLLEGMPANRVYKVCGFSDYACFYRAFKKEYGFSPSKLKQIHKECMNIY